MPAWGCSLRCMLHIYILFWGMPRVRTNTAIRTHWDLNTIFEQIALLLSRFEQCPALRFRFNEIQFERNRNAEHSSNSTVCSKVVFEAQCEGSKSSGSNTACFLPPAYYHHFLGMLCLKKRYCKSFDISLFFDSILLNNSRWNTFNILSQCAVRWSLTTVTWHWFLQVNTKTIEL